MALDGFSDQAFTSAAMRAEILDADTERALAIAWRDQRDQAALHRLITAYLRLAVAWAARFKRYGAPMNDLIQEASVGLMKAADKFDPDRGVRFSTYAVWWIKASMQDYVMRNWSMVRTGSTASQKTLFFNMRRVQAQLERDRAARGERLDRQQIILAISSEIGVPLRDVEMMSGRLAGGDLSLNARPRADDDGREWIDLLQDDGAQGADLVQADLDSRTLRSWLAGALMQLGKRERYILCERKLRATARTLESLGAELSLSKERIRQIEVAALAKMRDILARRHHEVHEFL